MALFAGNNQAVGPIGRLDESGRVFGIRRRLVRASAEPVDVCSGGLARDKGYFVGCETHGIAVASMLGVDPGYEGTAEGVDGVGDAGDADEEGAGDVVGGVESYGIVTVAPDSIPKPVYSALNYNLVGSTRTMFANKCVGE